MVELSTRKREIRGNRENHHEKLQHKIISCAGQYTIPNMTGTSSNPAGNYTNMRTSKSNRESHTPDSHICSYPPYCSHLHPPSLSFSSTTLPSSQKYKFKSLFSIYLCYDNEFTPCAAHTECSIHLGLAVLN